MLGQATFGNQHGPRGSKQVSSRLVTLPITREDAGALAARGFLVVVVCTLLLGIIALVFAISGSHSPPRTFPSSELRLIEAAWDVSTPNEASRALLSESSKKGYSANKQPDEPFWLGMTIEGWQDPSETRVVELRMLRASSMSFWQRTVGDAGVLVPVSAVHQKGGIAVTITAAAGQRVEVLGLVNPITIARPKVFLWNESDFYASERMFERWGGALVGASIVLAIFSVLVGGLNRDWSFFLFAGWLITSLRVSAINDGWDLLWLGVNLPTDALLILLRVTLAAHALLTITLFRALLANNLQGLVLDKWLVRSSVVFAGVLISAFFLPHREFLPILWSTSALGIVLIITSLTVVVYRTRSSVSIWYAGSWILTFAGILTEVGYASGFLSSSSPGLNSQTASVASAVFIAIALAEKLRIERVARQAAQRETFAALEKLRENYNSMPIGLFSSDLSGHLSLFNPAFSSMFRIPTSPIGERVSMQRLIGPDAFDTLQAARKTVGGVELELRVPHADGSSRWFLARVTSKEDSIEGSIQDITKRKEAENRLRHLVDHDSLTGLLNRRGLEEAMRLAHAAVTRGSTCAVARLDLDRFKLTNDLYGHATGDALLQQAAVRLSSVVRGSDYVARIADSFVIVLMECPDQAVIGLTERLRESVSEEPFELDGKSLAVTASIGVVSIDTAMTAVGAMAAADRACVEAKARGRNCVVRLTDQDAALKGHLEELQMVASLQRRIDTDRYFLEFQPIVSLRSAHQSLSYEVLIRMRGEDGGVVPPARFIGAAERNGLMSQIDRWVLRSTLEWLDANQEHRDRLTFATINLSGASLNDARFVEDAFAMVAGHPLAMTKLCFEVTESVALNDVGSTRRFVDRVRAYGSKVALDDFGAGYTSFNYLKEIPADFIKIDGSFVRDINQNPANYAITRTIVDLTHELGMSSVAEWVESADTVASLIDLGVDYAQGFGLARPMPKELVTQASSSGILVRDLQVQALLSSSRKLAALHPASARRR